MEVTCIASLLFSKKQFAKTSIDGITPGMLSKELRDLKLNGVVTRYVCNTKPISFEYELADSGKTIAGVLDKMLK